MSIWEETPWGDDSMWALDRGAPWLDGNMSIEDREDDREEVDLAWFTDMNTRVYDYDPRITLFFGLRGQGKSLAASIFAHKFKYDSWVYSDGLAPKSLVSNIRLAQGDITDPDIHMRFADEENNEAMRNSIVVWDEAAEVMNRMRTTSRVNVEVNHVLTMMRKLGSELLFTTQFPNAVTGMFNQQCDWYIRPNITKWKVPVDGEEYIRAYMDLDFWNWNGSITGYPAQVKYMQDLQPPQRSIRVHGVERGLSLIHI